MPEDSQRFGVTLAIRATVREAHRVAEGLTTERRCGSAPRTSRLIAAQIWRRGGDLRAKPAGRGSKRQRRRMCGNQSPVPSIQDLWVTYRTRQPVSLPSTKREVGSRFTNGEEDRDGPQAERAPSVLLRCLRVVHDGSEWALANQEPPYGKGSPVDARSRPCLSSLQFNSSRMA